MHTFTIDSLPTSQIYTFCRGPAHIVGNYPYRSNQILIFGTTQPVNSVSSQILMPQIHVVLERTPSFTIASSYPITQMSNV
jgi:hypothetical protein